MNRFTHTGFVLIVFAMISTSLFSQEKNLPDNAEMIRLMRQYGITAKTPNSASAVQPAALNQNPAKSKNQDGSRAAYQLFDNGPFVTHPGAGVGGADFSMTYAPYQQIGYQANWPNYRITDDFVVSGDESWTIESIRLFAFQQGSGTSPSPITKAFIQIWDAAPNAGGTLIWGDVVTNRMNNTQWANCYRGNAVSQTARPIMEVDCQTPNLVLAPGTYWIDYSFEGTPGLGTASIIPVTVTGQSITGNGYYTFNAGGFWFWLGSVIYQQGAPFTVFGYQGDPLAPEVIADFTVTPAAMGALSADLAWTNPSVTQSGDPLASLTSVSIYRDDVLIYENTSPGIGTAETYTDIPDQPGLYFYEIFSANASGNSPKVSIEVYVGEDVPAAPANVTMTPVNDNTDAEITWDEPTEGLNGAYFTGATGYTIVRMPDSTVLATNWSGTQPFVDNTIPAFGYYAYRIIAVNAIGNGGMGVSNGELLGPYVYFQPAYANNYATHDFVSVDVITGKQTFISDNTFDPSGRFPKETIATFADGVYYIGDAVNGNLLIKTDDGTEIPVGPIVLDGDAVLPIGLAYDAATTTMYIKVINPTSIIKALCTIDLNTLELTLISEESIVLDATAGLEFLPDGYLYSVNISTEELVKIDPATGERTVVGDIGFNANDVQTLSYEPTLNRLYSYAHGLGDDRYGYYDLTTGLFNPLSNNLEAWTTGFAIKDPLSLEEVDAVAFYIETPEIVKEKFGVGETTPVSVIVGNYGLSAASFDITLEIEDEYSETISVTELGSVEEAEIAFPDWTPLEAGEYSLVLTVSDPGGDGNLENNSVSRTVSVYDGCKHTLSLYSQFGDSWYGDWAKVEINSQVYYDYITKPAGNGGYVLPVYAEEGDEIKLTYRGDGLYSWEHSWELLDGEGIQLFTGVGATGQTINQTATANCPDSPAYTHSAYANNWQSHEFVSVDVITGKQTFIANNTFDPISVAPKEGVATFADGVYYVGDGINNSLFIKNDDGTEVPLGPLSLNGASATPWGLAYDAANSIMYIKVYVASTSQNALCTIDLNTLQLTLISQQFVFMDFSSGLEFLPDGYLYSVDLFYDKLIKINPATGTKTVVGSVGFNLDNVQALSYEPTTDRLYSYAQGYEYNSRYGYYNLTTGLFIPLTIDLEAYTTGFAIKDPLALEDVDAVAFYAETPEVIKHKFGVGETTPVNVKVGNYGLSAASFDVTLEIGDDYSETISVTNLGSIEETVVTFPDWTPIETGEYNLLLTVSDPGGDGNPDNNMISRTINVYDGCRHILMLMTSHIGWEGDWASVKVNSQVFYDSLTRPGGEQGFPVYAEDGDIITFTYHGDALYNNTYHFWELVDYEGNTLLEGTGEPHAVIEQTATANCPGSNEANILTFSFNVTENPSLFADISGTIDPATFSITLDVPENVDLSSLIATFTLSDLATASIGGVSQESGVTANNFSAPVVYTVSAEAGNTQDWTVTVNIVECEQPWGYIITGKVHSISIPVGVAPEIFGTPLAAFDWIGVFYLDDNGMEACGGAVQWNGESGVVINAYGNDATTPEKDGFATGEAFRWRLQQCGNPEDYTALAAYDAAMPNHGSFADFGLSKLTSLQAAFIQDYELNQGWNSISSYVVPFDAAVESMFAPMVNQLTILRNLSSLYWPAEGLNTIGDWDNFSGYVLKATEALGFQVAGAEFAPGEVTIPAGWSYLPVLSHCDANVMDMFGDYLNDVVIIQELIGTKVFWPAFEIYSLETFMPGKAYIIKLNNEVTVSFPDCTDKSNAELPKRANRIDTKWGNISMTPVSQFSMFMEEALEELVQGDVIGAFDQDGNVYGYLSVNVRNENQSMTLFGDDLVSQAANGFVNDEPVNYKLMRTSTGEVFELEVVYSPILGNTSGNFVAGSFAAISDLKLSATGMGEMTSYPIGFYPNPASDNITITGIAGKAEVGIFNVFGKEVFTGIISGSASINLSGIAKGTYMVRISDGSSVNVKKLVIK